MDKTRIFSKDEEIKFEVLIKDFDMEANDFGIQLIYGYRRNKVEIQKSQMIHGSDNKWYLTFDTEGMVGRVEVECWWQVPDTDYADGYRKETNLQYLGFAATTPDCQYITCPACGCDTNQPVKYTRTETSSIADDYAYLLTSEGDRLITSDNEYILVLKSNE